MPTIELVTSIAAPIERVFDLARSIDLHTNSTSTQARRTIAGVTSGLIGPGQEVTWRARHFGVWQSFTVRVTVFGARLTSPTRCCTERFAAWSIITISSSQAAAP